MPQDKKNLRIELRKKRKSLSIDQQINAAVKLKNIVVQRPEFIKAKNIAFYLPSDGEISPEYIIDYARQKNKNCYLPCISKNKNLIFRRYRANSKMIINEFNISEPNSSAIAIQALKLDIVFMPLVGFDLSGNRLGMGGGFYDRTFAKKQKLPYIQPKLFGLAHSLQKTENLSNDPWDVSLQAVITEKYFFRVRK